MDTVATIDVDDRKNIEGFLAQLQNLSFLQKKWETARDTPQPEREHAPVSRENSATPPPHMSMGTILPPRPEQSPLTEPLQISEQQPQQGSEHQAAAENHDENKIVSPSRGDPQVAQETVANETAQAAASDASHISHAQRPASDNNPPGADAPADNKSQPSTRRTSGAEAIESPNGCGVRAPPPTPLVKATMASPLSEADEASLVGICINEHLEKHPPPHLSESNHAPHVVSGCCSVKASGLRIGDSHASWFDCNDVYGRGESNARGIAHGRTSNSYKEGGSEHVAESEQTASGNESDHHTSGSGSVKSLKEPTIRPASECTELTAPAMELIADFGALMAGMHSFLSKYHPSRMACQNGANNSEALRVASETDLKEAPARSTNGTSDRRSDEAVVKETKDSASGPAPESREETTSHHTSEHAALSDKTEQDDSKAKQVSDSVEKSPDSKSSLSVNVDHPAECDKLSAIPEEESPKSAATSQRPPIVQQNEPPKGLGATVDLEYGFKKWPTPETRSGPAAQPRSVLISRLPMGVTVQFVASIVFGGPLESIIMGPRNTAKVTFVRSKDRALYLDATANGMIWSNEGGAKYVDVDPLKDVDLIGQNLQGMLDTGATRCVFAIAEGTEKSLEDLKEVRQIRHLKFECVEERQEKGGSCQQFNFRMCSIQDAVRLKYALATDDEWEIFHVRHYDDPCGLEWGSPQRRLHFASGHPFSPQS